NADLTAVQKVVSAALAGVQQARNGVRCAADVQVAEHSFPGRSMTFRDALSEQRWDDHRYYHHSRINQSLHSVRALSFLGASVMLFLDPAIAVMIAWLVSMPTRQAGHFFFEPRGYDAPNHATHEHKEAVKVGYNLQRKVVLMSIWVLSPL